jgi:hypothetical protein
MLVRVLKRTWGSWLTLACLGGYYGYQKVVEHWDAEAFDRLSLDERASSADHVQQLVLANLPGIT